MICWIFFIVNQNLSYQTCDIKAPSVGLKKNSSDLNWLCLSRQPKFSVSFSVGVILAINDFVVTIFELERKTEI